MASNIYLNNVYSYSMQELFSFQLSYIKNHIDMQVKYQSKFVVTTKLHLVRCNFCQTLSYLMSHKLSKS